MHIHSNDVMRAAVVWSGVGVERDWGPERSLSAQAISWALVVDKVENKVLGCALEQG